MPLCLDAAAPRRLCAFLLPCICVSVSVCGHIQGGEMKSVSTPMPSTQPTAVGRGRRQVPRG
eukprot:6266314-Alexandrium_andersonii.AAC.1